MSRKRRIRLRSGNCTLRREGGGVGGYGVSLDFGDYGVSINFAVYRGGGTAALARCREGGGGACA